MKKISIIVLLLALITLLLGGCESVADVEQIRTDLESFHDFLGENEKITALEIAERETEKENNVDVVYCTVTTMNDNCSYEKELILTYTYDKNNGWVLDYVSVNDSDEWVITPLSGVTEEEISVSLHGTDVYVDGEHWEIKKDNTASLSVEKHDTDIKGKTDTVIVNITIDDVVQQATGQLVVNYVFEKEWKIESITGNDTFTAQAKPGMELDVTDETLISALSGETIDYGAPKDGWYLTSQLQTISINEEEISNFTIKNHESLDKGTIQRFTCSCTLTKGNAKFTVDAIIMYNYISPEGWVLRPITITAECISVNIEGKWNGTYTAAPYSGTAVLSITSIEEDGTITGTYSYTPNTISKYSQPGSYKVTGRIDYTTMFISLAAGEWIEKPTSALSLDKQDISARLVVEESYIEGKGQHGYPFKVTKDGATQ